MTIELFHPSRSKLVKWLETGKSEKVRAHVEECERCADRLVVLDAEQVKSAEDPVGQERSQRMSEMLVSMYAAPDDLSERVIRSVEQRSKGEREFALFAGLMSVGLDTARFIATGPIEAHSTDVAEPHSDRHPDGDHRPGEAQ